MPYISNESLPYLVDKLIDANNIKISGNSHGTRVSTVVDKIVEKADTMTGAVSMSIENSSGNFKVGSGVGGIDVTKTTEDGFSKIALKGKTTQNLVLEGNKEIVPSAKMSVGGEATSFKLDGVQSGNMDFDIKGRTLKNLYPSVGWGKGYTINSNPSNPGSHLRYQVHASNFTFKELTEYTYILFVTENSLTGYANIQPVDNYNAVYSQYLKIQEGQTGVFRVKIKTIGYAEMKSRNIGLQSLVYAPNGDPISGRLAVSKILLVEGDHMNTPLEDLPYIEGIQGVGDKVESGHEIRIKSHGKNLVDSSKITRWSGNPSSLIHLEYPDFIPVKQNTSYIMNKDLRCVTFYNRDKQKISEKYDVRFTTPNECFWIKIRAFGVEGQNIYPSDYKDFQLEEGASVTQSQLYVEDSLSYVLDEQLHRLPNGACDEIKDGKLIRRVGKVILDGSQNLISNVINDNVFRFIYKTPLPSTSNTKNIISNNFPNYGDSLDRESVFQYTEHGIVIGLSKSKLTTHSMEGVKAWLRANPTEVYYELKEPIITELKQPSNLNLYSERTYITSSNTVLPMMKVNSNGKPYRALLKPNTSYTVKWRAKEGGEKIGLDIGGEYKSVDKTLCSTVIKTPSALVHNNLYVAGWGTKIKDVMVVEGENNTELNYISGIMGVGSNENLFDSSRPGDYFYLGVDDFYNNATNGLVEDGDLEVLRVYHTNSQIKTNLFKIGRTYTISGYFKPAWDSRRLMLCITYADDVEEYTEAVSMTTDYRYASFTFTVQREVKYITLTDQTPTSGHATLIPLDKFKIEEGSVDTGYCPYGTSKINIIGKSKNLFDKNNLYDNGPINIGSFHPDRKGCDIKVKPNTKYVFSAKGSYHYWFADYKKNYISGSNFDSSNFGTTVLTTPPDCHWFRLGAHVVESDLETLLFEEGTTKTEYTSYKEDATDFVLDRALMKLSSRACDEIKKGSLIRKVGRIILNGSEGWTDYGRYYSTRVSDMKTVPDALCDTIPVIFYQDMDQRGGVGMALVQGDIRISKSLYESIDVLKKWLQDNPTTVYYELATPIITDLPEPTARIFKDGHLEFNTLVAPTSTYEVQLNKSAQIESSISEVQSLDVRVAKLESFYDDMILETSHKLSLLDLDFDYMKESEEEV